MVIKIRNAITKDFDGVRRLSRNFYKEAASDPDFGDVVLFKRPSRGKKFKWFNKLLADVQCACVGAVRNSY